MCVTPLPPRCRYDALSEGRNWLAAAWLNQNARAPLDIVTALPISLAVSPRPERADMSPIDNEPSLHVKAVRAGRLFDVGGMTRDKIATELGTPRPRAQRLVSRAMAEGLIQVRL